MATYTEILGIATGATDEQLQTAVNAAIDLLAGVA
jgi:hypothetical protein